MKRNTHHSIATISATLFLTLLILNSTGLLQTNTQAASTDQNIWQLEVSGFVEHPLSLTLYEIQAMPQTTVQAAFYCVDFPYKLVESGNWTGVQLSQLLETAGISPSAVKVAFYASDGYTTDLSLEIAAQPNVIVAYEKDGTPIGTLRLITPGRWGYKWISQLTKIEIVNYDFLGKWEGLGYADDGIGAGPGRSNIPDVTINPAPKPNQQNTTTTLPTNPPASNSSETTPTQEAQEPTNEAPETQNPEGLPIVSIAVASAALVAIVSSVLLIHLRKRKQ